MRRSLSLIAFAAVAYSSISQPSSAAIVNPNMVITANFAATAPFDGYMIQVGFGGLSGAFPSVGDSLRARIFDDTGALFESVSATLSAGATSTNLWDVWSVSDLSSSFTVVLDEFVGSYEVQQVSFFPWLESTGYWDFSNSLIVRGGDLNISTIPLPAGALMLLTGLGLLSVTGSRMRRRA